MRGISYLFKFTNQEEEPEEENPYEEEYPGRIIPKVWREKDDDDTEADS